MAQRVFYGLGQGKVNDKSNEENRLWYGNMLDFWKMVCKNINKPDSNKRSE